MSTLCTFTAPSLKNWGRQLLPPLEMAGALVIGAIAATTGYPFWGSIALIGTVPGVLSYASLRYVVRRVTIDGDLLEWQTYFGPEQSGFVSAVQSVQGLEIPNGEGRQVRVRLDDGRSLTVTWHMAEVDSLLRRLTSDGRVRYVEPGYGERLLYFWRGYSRFYRALEPSYFSSPAAPRQTPRRRQSE